MRAGGHQQLSLRPALLEHLGQHLLVDSDPSARRRLLHRRPRGRLLAAGALTVGALTELVLGVQPDRPLKFHLALVS